MPEKLSYIKRPTESFKSSLYSLHLRIAMSGGDATIKMDRYSLNVVVESFSRFLSFAAGMLSSMMLYRSINWSWTYEQYAAVKVFTNTANVLLPFVLMGISGAISRTVAEYSDDKDKLGETIGATILFITLSFLAVSGVSVFLGLENILNVDGSSIGLTKETTSLYWAIVMVGLLPTAYMRVMNGIFKGIQQMKRILVARIVYNALRIGGLLFLFFNRVIIIPTVLWLNLIAVAASAALALVTLFHRMRINNIPWGFTPSRDVISSLSQLAGVFLLSGLVSSNMNNVTVLWMNFFGSPENVAHFSIAQGISLTARQMLAAPLAVLGPNLAVEYSRGRHQEMQRKFNEACSMMIPTYTFSFAALFGFAGPILRVLYGYLGVASAPFLQLISFNLILTTIPIIYDYVYLASNDKRGLILSQISQAILQTIWVIVVTPIIGVNAIAIIWVAYIPYFILQYMYSRKYHNVAMSKRKLVGGVSIGLIFAMGMYFLSGFVWEIISSGLLPNIVEATIITILMIPIWFLFLSILILLRLVDKKDLQNIERVLKVFPPAWWLSRPVVQRLKQMSSVTKSD